MDSHIHQLSNSGFGWEAQDLTEAAGGATLAAGDPSPYLTFSPDRTGNPFSTDSAYAVAYRGVDSRIYQLVDRDGDWLQQDLTLTLAAGDPYGFNYYAGGPGSREARAVVYRDVDSHIDVVGRIARMPFDPFEGTRLDLTDTYGAPLAAGDPVALERWPLTGFIVFYRGAASHIYSIKDGVTDLTDAAGGAPLAAGDPIVYVTPDSSIEPPGLLHVVYRGTDSRIYELYGTDSEGWRLTDLTETAAHPPQAAEFALIA